MRGYTRFRDNRWGGFIMKKIQLSDGMPTDILSEDQPKEVVSLLDKIMELSLKSGLSYVEVNKALYLADKGLFERTIWRRRSQI